MRRHPHRQERQPLPGPGAGPPGRAPALRRRRQGRGRRPHASPRPRTKLYVRRLPERDRLPRHRGLAVLRAPARRQRRRRTLHPYAEGKPLVGAALRDRRGVAPGAAGFRRLVQYALAGRPLWPQDTCSGQGRSAERHRLGRMNYAAACLTTLVQYSLYIDPPERALVLCVDEKSQIQALDRTQPLLPMRPGQAERRTNDYKRHGTTSVFAALDVKAGTIIGTCMPRHRAQEFRRFLDTVENNVPADLDIHVVMDNASSHKTKLIRDWFAKRPRWHTHFTPTSASWINQVERFFALLTEQQIKRGAHRSIKELEAAIAAYVDAHNAYPKPFRCTKTADDILASIERFCRRTVAVQAQCG